MYTARSPLSERRVKLSAKTPLVDEATVGGTPKSSTIPPRGIGRVATLKDMRIWGETARRSGLKRRGSCPGIGSGGSRPVGSAGK